MACIYIYMIICIYPRGPITLSVDDWGVQSPPQCKVFRFHCHSQKVIGSLGYIYIYTHDIIFTYVYCVRCVSKLPFNKPTK